jgi:hypothetical protein
MDKQIFRCNYRFPSVNNQSGGVVFLRAFSKEEAEVDAKRTMQEQLDINGFSKVPFTVEVYPSSMEEAELYRQKMADPTVDKEIN